MGDTLKTFLEVSDNFNSHMLNKAMYKNTNHTSTYFPNKVDNLFWCIFIHVFTLEEYLQIECKYKNREIDEKMKIVQCIQKNINCMKSMKITKVDSQTIIGDIMTNEKITLFSLHALSIYFKLHIYVVCQQNKTYIEYNNSPETTDCIIYKNTTLSNEKNTNYSIDRLVTKEMIRLLKDDFVKYETYNRILKNIANYKRNDLDKVATKLGIEPTNKCSKQELFDIIANV